MRNARWIIVWLLMVPMALMAAGSRDMRPYRMEVGLQGGCGYYTGDANGRIFQNVREAYGAQFRYRFTPRWSLAAYAMQHTIAGRYLEQDGLWRNHMINVDVTAEFNFFRFGKQPYDKNYKPISPYLFLGIGASVYGQEWGLNHLTGYVPVGFGLKWKFADRWGLNIKWQHNIYFTDRLEQADDMDNTYGLNGSNWFNCDVTSQLTVGLVLEFAKTKKICKQCEL